MLLKAIRYSETYLRILTITKQWLKILTVEWDKKIILEYLKLKCGRTRHIIYKL